MLAAAGAPGYLVGAWAGWAIGRFGGRPLLERRGPWFHLGHERLVRAEAWFERFGSVAVLLGRLTPVVRSFISIPAGVFQLPLGVYTLLTPIGSAVWAFAFAAAAGRLAAAMRALITPSASPTTSSLSRCSPRLHRLRWGAFAR